MSYIMAQHGSSELYELFDRIIGHNIESVSAPLLVDAFIGFANA